MLSKITNTTVMVPASQVIGTILTGFSLSSSVLGETAAAVLLTLTYWTT